jgi:hypothetical protein
MHDEEGPLYTSADRAKAARRAAASCASLPFV